MVTEVLWVSVGLPASLFRRLCRLSTLLDIWAGGPGLHDRLPIGMKGSGLYRTILPKLLVVVLPQSRWVPGSQLQLAGHLRVVTLLA